MLTPFRSIDRWLFADAAPGDRRRMDLATRSLAAVIGLRIALGPYRALAGQPRSLFRPTPLFTALDAMPSLRVFVALQILGVVAALVAVVRPGRAALPVAWVSLLVLAGLRGSLGKILHNDVLLLLAVTPFVIYALASDKHDDRPWPARGALVVVAAAYFFSGYHKLLQSGLDWVFSDNFRWVLYGGAASGRGPDVGVARFIADRPALAVASAAALLLLELTFPIVLFSPRSRRFYGCVAIVMHVGTWVTLGLDYWTWVAVDAVVLLYATAPSPSRPRPGAPEGPDARRVRAVSGTE